MINGLTKEEYAAKAADLCASAICMSDLKLHIVGAVTQIVSIDMPRPEPQFPWYRNETIVMPHIRLYAHTISRYDWDIEIPFDGSKSIRDAVYDSLYETLSNDADADHYSVDTPPANNPAFMFITRIRCAHYEDPKDVQSAYIKLIERKFGVTLPEEFVMVSSDIEKPDFCTGIKFVAEPDIRPLKGRKRL